METAFCFEFEADGIYRLRIPFAEIYTSVFLIVAEERRILVDCATTEHDVDCCIVSALKKMDYELSDIDTIVLTHRHGDHAGGLDRIMALNPHIKVVSDLGMLCENIYTYPMTGHTRDSIGVLDMRTGTLIAGDGLQGAGVDRFPCYTQDQEAYVQTIERIRCDTAIENLLFSHAYEPWCADRQIGRTNVLKCLKLCIDEIEKTKKENG